MEQKTENKKLITRIPVNNTPFTMVEYEGRYFLTFGNYILLTDMESFAEIELALETNMWNIMGAYIHAIVDTIKKNEGL